MDEFEAHAHRLAAQLGAMIRERRRSLGLLQEQISMVTGVSRRFIIDLEAGKSSCQLGKALMVAEAVGMTLQDLMTPQENAFDLPEISDEEDEDNVPASRIF